MKSSTICEKSRYVRPCASVCTFSAASSLLQLSGGEPDSLTIVDVTDDNDFNY